MQHPGEDRGAWSTVRFPEEKFGRILSIECRQVALDELFDRARIFVNPQKSLFVPGATAAE